MEWGNRAIQFSYLPPLPKGGTEHAIENRMILVGQRGLRYVDMSDVREAAGRLT